MRSYLHIVTFILLNFTAGCGARVHVVYKSIGEKAHLTLKEHWNITTVKWRKDHDLIGAVENQKPVIKHPGKFHIHASDKSLYIHNLTVNDSGDYKAQTGLWEEEVIKYKLIVQEAISVPVISANPDHQSNSSACNILVKCSADGESVTYFCDNRHCTRTNTTSTRVNITINYIDNEALKCTASNRVSTKQATILISNICSEKPPASPKSDNILVVIILTTCFCILVSGVLIFCIVKYFCNTRTKRQNEGTYQEDKGVNTVYSVVRKQPRTETPEDCSAAQNAAGAVYDVPSKCARAPQSESHDNVQKDDTHTVYWKLGQTQDP